MDWSDEFAHGKAYGDLFGVHLYARKKEEAAPEKVAVSAVYMDPLLKAVFSKAASQPDAHPLPRLVSEWNSGVGWSDIHGSVPVPPGDAEALAAAFEQLTPPDLALNHDAWHARECLRCAQLIVDFLRRNLADDHEIFIEND